MQKTFLFYDLETSGLNPAFDQVIQFSAIRTDLHLNELERYEWVVRPNADVIPSPAAMIIHRTPLHIWQQGESEFVVMQRIHALFNTPGTISLGYNTLGFDDEFLRFSFYRNLLAPYTHQYANGCSRADIYPITALYYLFHPDLLKWPIRNDKISLKLDALNAENALATGAAHTAIVDIEVTIALAKKMMLQHETWLYALGYFNKEIDTVRMEKLPELLRSKKLGLMIDGIYGANLNFCTPTLQLGTHRHYKNQTCWLRLDTEKLSQATEKLFKEHCWVVNKKIGEPGFLLPLNEKYVQKCDANALSIMQKNVDWLMQHPEIFDAITHYYLDFTYPKYPNVDPGASLYTQPFWNAEQQQVCQQFHRVDFSQKKNVIDIIRNPILKTLAIRALARYDVSLLSPEQKTLWKEDKEHVGDIIDYKGQKKLSVTQALEDIEKLRADVTLDVEQQQLLEIYRDYLQ